jgi:hypothetical protein
MDLNYLYSQHQISLICADRATSRLARTKHLAAAGLLAHRISKFQQAQGAVACEGWLIRSGSLEQSDGTAPGLAT